MPSKPPVQDMAAAIDSAPVAPDLTEPDSVSGGDGFDSVILPPDCPVTPLGHLKKSTFFLDFAGQLIELGSEFRKGEIMLLFGHRMGWLEAQKNLAQWVNKGTKNNPKLEKDGFNQTKVQKALIHACTTKGLFDPTGKVRGRGSHSPSPGQVVLHCGDRVLIGGRKGARGEARPPAWSAPGLIGENIYPTAPTLPHPADRPAKASDGRGLLSLLSAWNWKSGTRVALSPKGMDDAPIEALLMLGWIGCAKFCGAIKWRPHVWLVGPSGAGKSTLQDVISRLLAGWALESDDPSEAWISQSLLDQRLPVLYDEPEPGEDGNAFIRKIILLARLASGGGKRGRGSSDHKAIDFSLFSCFLFSSIMHHQLEQQDRNRMAIMELAQFPPDTAAMDGDAIEADIKRWGLTGTLAEIGLATSRRLLEQWPRYLSTLGAYQAELMRRRVDPRGQSTYGELLAMADMILFDRAPMVELDLGDPNPIDEEMEEALSRCRRLVDALAPMLSIAQADSENIADRCLGRLSTFLLPSAKGQHPEGVGRWIEKAVTQLWLETLQPGTGIDREAREKLRTYGMKIVQFRTNEKGEPGALEAHAVPETIPLYLAVANHSHSSLKALFKGTSWANGEWDQALRRIDGARQEKIKIRYDGPPCTSVLVPIGQACDMNAARTEAGRILNLLAARAQS